MLERCGGSIIRPCPETAVMEQRITANTCTNSLQLAILFNNEQIDV